MGLKAYNESDILNIANALREKSNTTDTYKVSDMAGAVSNIQGGGVVEEISITSNGVYTPREGVDGYNVVNVQVPTSGPDLSGVINSVMSRDCTMSKGLYSATAENAINYYTYDMSFSGVYGNSIYSNGVENATNLSHAFEGSTAGDFRYFRDLDFTNVTNVSYLFANATSGNSSKLEFRSMPNSMDYVTNMAYMFYNSGQYSCLFPNDSFYLPPNIENLSHAFDSNRSLKFVNIDLLEIPESAKDVSYMFNSQPTFLNINNIVFLGNNITNMAYMFFYVNNIKASNLYFNGFRSLNNMVNAFYTCNKISGCINVSNSNINCMSYAFSGCPNITEVSFTNSYVNNMTYAFYNCKNLSGVGYLSGNGNRYYSNIERAYAQTNINSLILFGKLSMGEYLNTACDDATWNKINSISFDNTFTNMSYLFMSMGSNKNAYYNSLDRSGLATQSICTNFVTNMSSAYKSCNTITGSPIVGSSVVNLINAYMACGGLDNSIVWYSTQAEYATYAFYKSNIIGSFNIMFNNLIDISHAFEACTNLYGTLEICTNQPVKYGARLTDSFRGALSKNVGDIDTTAFLNFDYGDTSFDSSAFDMFRSTNNSNIIIRNKLIYDSIPIYMDFGSEVVEDKTITLNYYFGNEIERTQDVTVKRYVYSPSNNVYVYCME